MMTSPAALVGWWMLFWSLASFFVMGIDKRAAFTTGERRVSESSLLLMTLVGGWPGTLSAMQWYRHKRRKAAFKYRCLLAIIVNIWAILVMFNLNYLHP